MPPRASSVDVDPPDPCIVETWLDVSRRGSTPTTIALWHGVAGPAAETIDVLLRSDALLWIDDLHDETIDWNIWRKHVQPLIEERVKHEMPTIVCTTLPPDDDSFLPRVSSTGCS